MEFIKSFFQIKKIIVLLTTIVFCILAIRNNIFSTDFLSVFTMIVSFYIGSSSTRQAIKETKE